MDLDANNARSLQVWDVGAARQLGVVRVDGQCWNAVLSPNGSSLAVLHGQDVAGLDVPLTVFDTAMARPR
jgi:hypothetical protein